MQNLGPRLLNRALNRNLVDKGGAVGVFASAPLDLRFALQKTLDPRVTHTRVGSAANAVTYVGSDGLIKTAVTNLLLRSEEFGTTWTLSQLLAFGSGSVADATTAPNGTLTADRITENTATAQRFVNQSVSGIPASSVITASCYVKFDSANRNFSLQITDAPSGGSGYAELYLTQGGVVTSPTPSSFTNRTATVENVGSGWYRVRLTITTAAVTTITTRLFIVSSVNAQSYTGDGTSGIYLWGAQLEQASTVGDYVPTGATINSAPRFDHNPTTGESLGLLVEEARTNSITNNTMVGAVAGTPGTLPTGWPFQVATNGLAISIVGTGTESGIAYLDWRISGTATAAATGDICFGRASALTAQTWTISSYLKLVSGSLSGVTGATLSLIEETAAFAFVTGALYSISLPTAASLITQRPAATRTLTGGATVALVRTNLTFNVSSGSTVDFTIRIGLPQLEQGAFATSVIPTTSATVTRAADVASITGANFGTTRTNLLLRSEEFDTASWGPVSGTVTANAETSPTGTLTADKLIAANGGPQGQLAQGATITSGATVTGFVYAKAGGFDRLELVLLAANNTTPYGRSTFNPNTGVITTAAFTSNGGTNASSAVQALSNGWYRFSVTVTYPAVTSAGMRLVVSNSDAANGDGVKGVFLWGAQLETGSTATAYIPTTTAAVSVFESSWYNQTEGTVFVDVTARPDGLVCNFDDGSFSNRKPQIAIGAGASCDGAYVAAGSTVASFSQASTSNQRNLIATAYATDNYGFTSNGATPAQDSLGALPSAVTTLRFGRFHNGIVPLYGTIKRLTYWPVRLANTVLQQITL
jgi:hypothetical protein